MKVRAGQHAKRVVMELGPDEDAIPPSSVPGLTLKRILVPVDFSPPSRKAAQYAGVLAKQFDAEVELLHVMEIAPPPPQTFFAESGLFLTRLRQDSADVLEEWRSEFLRGAKAKTILRDAVSAWNEIVSAAAETNADLIVLGTRGRTGLARMLIGSTAERVVRHAQCPVLVVREKESDFVHAPATASQKEGRKTATPAKGQMKSKRR